MRRRPDQNRSVVNRGMTGLPCSSHTSYPGAHTPATRQPTYQLPCSPDPATQELTHQLPCSPTRLPWSPRTSYPAARPDYPGAHVPVTRQPRPGYPVAHTSCPVAHGLVTLQPTAHLPLRCWLLGPSSSPGPAPTGQLPCSRTATVIPALPLPPKEARPACPRS